MFIKKHPGLLDSKETLANSKIIGKEEAAELLTTMQHRSKCLLDEANDKLTKEIQSIMFELIDYQRNLDLCE